MARFHCDRSSHFFIPFVSWFYLGYTIKVTNSETLYLKYKLKKKGIKYLFSIISHVLRKKTINLFLDVDKCEYDSVYYCEASSYCSSTVGSYICTSYRKYRLEQQ